MAKQYSAEFKLEAVRRIERTKEPVARVAAELGVNENTMHRCLKQYRVAKLCKVLLVSRSGYYAWDNRPKSKRVLENEAIIEEIKTLHVKKRETYGSRKMTAQIRRKRLVNHKRIERLMKEAGIRSKIAKKFKATTNSKHSLPVAKICLIRSLRPIGPIKRW